MPSQSPAGRALPPPLVHIADADLRTCETLGLLVRLEGFQSTHSTSASEFEMSLQRRPPNAAVINRALSPDDAEWFATRIRQASPGAPVIFLQDTADVDAAVEGMRAGAVDVLVKPVDGERLLRTLRQGFSRNAHLGGRVGGIRRLHVSGFPTLTGRERQVLELLVNGQTNRQVAEVLEISPRTVEVYRSSVMQKLGARNLASLVSIAMEATRN